MGLGLLRGVMTMARLFLTLGLLLAPMAVQAQSLAIDFDADSYTAPAAGEEAARAKPPAPKPEAATATRVQTRTVRHGEKTMRTDDKPATPPAAKPQ
jgi:hypothetical protein